MGWPVRWFTKFLKWPKLAAFLLNGCARISWISASKVSIKVWSLKDLQEAGFEVIGADMEGESLASHKVSPRSVLVFGSEGSGLRRLVRERCDKILAIPGKGKVGSLNVGATAAIFLYEFCRKR